MTLPLFTSGVATVKQIHTVQNEARPPCLLGLTGAAVLLAGRPSDLILMFSFLFVITCSLELDRHNSNPRATCVLAAFLKATLFFRHLCGISFYVPSSQFFFLFLSIIALLPLSAYFSSCTVCFSSSSHPCFLTLHPSAQNQLGHSSPPPPLLPLLQNARFV